MSIPLVNIAPRKAQMGEDIHRILAEIISHKNFIGGRYVDEFASSFAWYCGGGFCAPVANGTDALSLALRALGIGRGDEVLTVPYTFIATAEAISAVGATIKFVDVDPKYFTINVDLLKKSIGPKSKAIIPVHLYGQPADMDPLLEVACERGLKVIEDAAQAHGALYKGKKVGLLGDAGCFSFYPTKNLGGFGDGGAVVSSSRDLIEKITRLANHGRGRRDVHEIEGGNSRLDALQAGVLSVKLKYLEEDNQRRIDIAARYGRALANNSFITSPVVAPYAKHVFHLYCVESIHRESLMKYLSARGVGCAVYYSLPLHLQPAYAAYQWKRGDYPFTEALAERLLAIPMSPALTDEEIEKVCACLRDFSPNKY